MKTEALYHLYSQHYLVDTDTRNIRKNTIFFALKGENFNGNKFANQAIEKGAIFSIVDEEEFVTSAKIILVENVLKTLQSLANFHRKRLNIPVIGLTGSNGKTTTKELIHAVLSKKYKTTSTKGNLNNHIGVPLTLLSMTPSTEIGIVEMGANHQKEIAFLSTICAPSFGYITNFGKAHLEGFGGVAGVIKGKSELYDYIKQHNNTVFVNNLDALQMEKTKNINRIIFDENLKLEEVNPFVKLKVNNTIISSNLIGTYNFANICAAITIGKHFKVDFNAIKDAIAAYIPNNNRSQIIQKKTNKIVLDAYNANPTSMKAALESFRTMEENNKIVILGDMFELGEAKIEEHQNIIHLLEELQFENVFLIGELFYETNTYFKKFRDFDALKLQLISKKVTNATLLIKGSRGMKLERVLDII